MGTKLEAKKREQNCELVPLSLLLLIRIQYHQNIRTYVFKWEWNREKKRRAAVRWQEKKRPVVFK